MKYLTVLYPTKQAFGVVGRLYATRQLEHLFVFVLWITMRQAHVLQRTKKIYTLVVRASRLIYTTPPVCVGVHGEGEYLWLFGAERAVIIVVVGRLTVTGRSRVQRIPWRPILGRYGDRE
jgi:hypothetical protein